MKTIAQHIETLLTQHECVIVPSLGGFLVYHDTAKIHNNSISAPSNKIRFNALLSHHDGLLAEAIMKERNLSYSDALAVINSEISLLKSSIENGDITLFGTIGSFSVTNNHITFTQGSHKFIPENLGLPTIKLTKIQKETKQQTTNHKQIVIPLPNSSSKTFRYAASIAIIFMLTFFTPTIKDGSYKANLMFNTLSFDNTKVESTNITQTPQLDTITTITPKPLDFKFHIIIASLPELSSAKQYISDNTHISALQIVEKDNKFRISEKGFHSYNEALSYLDSIKEQKSAWILCL